MVRLDENGIYIDLGGQQISMPIELLAPAGSPASLRAAVEAGADSVYMGSFWNARMRARNFTKEELATAMKYCRAEGVKAYIALNTIIFESELKAVAEYIKFVYEYGADALILQDLGAARIAREAAPGLELHASTQMSVHNSKTAKLLKKIGFTRLILARELSIGQAAAIKKNANIDVEAFCHGALCYSYSGKCLWSYVQTGRSGNRGVCSQLCRFPWKAYCDGKLIRKGYLTSTKDLNLVGCVPEIEKTGIDCIKIEGRLKDARYVSAVVSAYRKAIDGGKDAFESLAMITSRGYTSGYLFGDARREKLTNPDRPAYGGMDIGKVVKVTPNGAHIKLTGILKKGDSIRASSSGKIISIYRMYVGDKEVESADSECALRIKTLKRGDTLVKVERAKIEDGFLKGVNAEKVRKGKSFVIAKKRLNLQVHSVDFDKIISWEAATHGIQGALIDTPRVVFDEEINEVEEKLRELAEGKPSAFLVSEPALVSDYPTVVSQYANVSNTLAAQEWADLGRGSVKGIVAAMEVNQKDALAMGLIHFTGKKIELAISENNLFRELGLAEKQAAGCRLELEDPGGNRFPVKLRGGRTVIYSPAQHKG